MKKLLALLCISLVAMFSFTGCGNTNKVVNDAENMATDAVDSVGDALKDDKNNGKVTDDDGIIDNEDNNSGTTNNSTNNNNGNNSNNDTNNKTTNAATEDTMM